MLSSLTPRIGRITRGPASPLPRNQSSAQPAFLCLSQISSLYAIIGSTLLHFLQRISIKHLPIDGAIEARFDRGDVAIDRFVAKAPRYLPTTPSLDVKRCDRVPLSAHSKTIADNLIDPK